MRIIELDEIKRILPNINLIPDIETGFIAYSTNLANVPPVGELIMEKGEVHIKYGCLNQDEFYVIKIASGFYENHQLGLATGNGLMLLFSQETGELVCILLDEGYLTDIRTAVAGAIAAKHLAPRKVDRIGIVGAGVQARQQLLQLKNITGCRQVLVWSKFEEELPGFKQDMDQDGFQVETTSESSQILKTCNLVVTCTPSQEVLLSANDLQTGTHITAVGSDTPEKQELDSNILRQADLVVADSIPQCLLRGEIYRALGSGHIVQDSIVELGNVISGAAEGRTSDSQITVSDLTGVAVQDIKIASAVFYAAS